MTQFTPGFTRGLNEIGIGLFARLQPDCG